MARIILIDDDPLFAGLVRKRLEADGHSVEYNEGAFGALTAVRHGRHDLILVDVQMPQIEGPQLVKVLRDRGVQSARILLMSSIEESDLQRKSQDYGAHGYICKGWGLEEIASCVGRETRRAGAY